MSSRKIKWNEFYIVDFSDIRNVHYYDKSVWSKEQARELIDSYLGEGDYAIFTGKEVEQLHVTPFHKTPFSKYIPKQKRSPRPDLRRKRKRKKGLATYKFRAIWDELPPTKKERHRQRLKDRTIITNQILK